jgi:hypothetical protein
MNVISTFIDVQQGKLKLKKIIWFDFEFFCQIKMCFEIKNRVLEVYIMVFLCF